MRDDLLLAALARELGYEICVSAADLRGQRTKVAVLGRDGVSVPHDPLSFSRDGLEVWQCYLGWATARRDAKGRVQPPWRYYEQLEPALRGQGPHRICHNSGGRLTDVR